MHHLAKATKSPCETLELVTSMVCGLLRPTISSNMQYKLPFPFWSWLPWGSPYASLWEPTVMPLLMTHSLDSWETRCMRQSEHLYLKFLSFTGSLSIGERGRRHRRGVCTSGILRPILDQVFCCHWGPFKAPELDLCRCSLSSLYKPYLIQSPSFSEFRA